MQRRDRLVTKSELLDLVWPGLVVEENNLQVQISALRKLLGPQAIATVPGRGYRFTAALDGAAARKPKSVRQSRCPQRRHRCAAQPLTNLPKELPPLYGREADLQALCALIDANRLVTVVGAGGIGKSRLAQAVAHRWPAAGPTACGWSSWPACPTRRCCRTPWRRRSHINWRVRARRSTNSSPAWRRGRCLLVLDNCEHLLDAAASAGAGHHAAAHRRSRCCRRARSRCACRSSSNTGSCRWPCRRDTAISGAREFGAVALFEARVRAVDPRFALNDESLAVVIDICRRLDGLPLAIELAAARVATLGLRPLHDKLDARFKLLTGGSRATLRRHQTLRAALEWSHNLLNDGEQAVFRRLGVFAGGFAMELAQAVAGDAQLDEWAVLEHLSALVDKSLVVADAGDPPRYRLLESARAFALEQLAAGETAETLNRHALPCGFLAARRWRQSRWRTAHRPVRGAGAAGARQPAGSPCLGER